MKILFIGMTENKEGTETFIMSAARLLWKLPQNEVYFLDVESKEISHVKEIKQNKGKIIKYKIHKGPSGLLFNKHEAMLFFKQYSFDIVHVNTNILRNSFWAIAAKESGVKKVFLHSHNSSYGNRTAIKKMVYRLTDFFDRCKLKKSNVKLLAASKEAGAWMFHNLPFMVINNGVDTSQYKFNNSERNIIRNKLSLPNDCLVVVSVARLTYQKNQEKIIRIFNKIEKEIPNSKLLLVGEGKDFEKLKKQAEDLKIDKKVCFLGRRNDINRLLSAADIMLFPSRYEGTPYSLMEAQSSGLPVLVSTEAFRKEEDITGNVSFLSLSATDQEWSLATLKLLDETKATDRRDANIKVKQSKYSMEYFNDQLRTLYYMN